MMHDPEHMDTGEGLQAEDWDELTLEGFNEDEDREHERDRMFETAQGVELVILVGVSQPPSQMPYETDEHLEELEMLVDTAGGEVVGKVYQSRSSINTTTFIGKGKVQILKDLCEDEGVNTVVFDDDLSPRQQRNLEEDLNRKVVDRTALILDIFAQHAKTKEAKTQVELAQLEYVLPRLTGMWTHLSKQYGGIRTKGPGETQIETDRRLVRDRIAHLKDKLEQIHKQRLTQRKSRQDVTKVALVGYTNVGKSTLLNILTDAGVLAENKLFATLDSTVRAYELNGRTLLLTDTVGFIRKLPTKLVASFKSTLLEVTDADIIVHVVDCTHPIYKQQMAVVRDTLKELDAGDKPTITVFNKVDLIESPGALQQLQSEHQNGVFISAERGMNLGELQSALQRILDEAIKRITVRISPPDFKLAAEFHTDANVLSETYEDDSIVIQAEIKPELLNRLSKLYPESLTIE
jgi:GTP-binding protein HflX